MKILVTVLLLGMLTSCMNDNKGGVEDEVLTLEMTSIVWKCDCARWILNDIFEEVSSNINDTRFKVCCFIEPIVAELALPDSLGIHGCNSIYWQLL